MLTILGTKFIEFSNIILNQLIINLFLAVVLLKGIGDDFGLLFNEKMKINWGLSLKVGNWSNEKHYLPEGL